MTAASEDPLPRLRRVRVDPFGTSDLARDKKLTAHEAWLWHVLALQSEYRSAEWSGTQTDMADATRLGRNTVYRALQGLTAKGLLRLVEPFRPGADGRVVVLFREWVRPKDPIPQIAPDDAKPVEPDRAPSAPPSRSHRAPTASSGAIEQGEGGGREVLRHRGSGEEVEAQPEALCECGHTIRGHPFTHKPVPVLQEDSALAGDPPPPRDSGRDRWTPLDPEPDPVDFDVTDEMVADATDSYVPLQPMDDDLDRWSAVEPIFTEPMMDTVIGVDTVEICAVCHEVPAACSCRAVRSNR